MVKITSRDRVIATLIMLGIIVVIAIISVVFCPNKLEIMTPGNIALSVDGTKVSKGFYNYFYEIATRPEVMAQMESLYDYNDDIPMDEQYFDEEAGITWEEYFSSSALEQVQSIVLLANRGKSTGVGLFKEQKERIQIQIDELEKQAEEYGVPTNTYTTIVYGEYVGKETIKKVLEMSYIAQNYYEYLYIGSRMSENELEKYYIENVCRLSMVSFEYYEINCDECELAADVQAGGRALDSVTDSVSFCFRMNELYTSDEYISPVAINDAYIDELADFPSTVTDWLYDTARCSGEACIFENEATGSYIAVMITAPVKIDSDFKYAIREIFIDNEDSEWEECVNRIISEVSSSDVPEYVFAVFADLYNDADVQSGGLVSGLCFDDVVGDLGKWMNDIERVPGDYFVIEGNKGSYIYYFVDKCEGWKYTAHELYVADLLSELLAGIDVK